MKNIQNHPFISNIFKKRLHSCNALKLFTFFTFIASICLNIILLLPQSMLPTLSQKISANGIMTNTPSKFTVVIDAGHGGYDPGKVGTTGTLEKDINLKIALYLKEMLEGQDIEVIMTRDEDEELSTDSSRRKASDMKERVALIDKSNADMVVSIHQNSYTDPQIYGAQCFYYTNSEEGEKLASIIQEQIINSTNQTKIRDIKSNSDYYLLKYSTLATVIVECGFLSNPEEEQLLLTETYQRKMAWAIHLGILQYLNQK